MDIAEQRPSFSTAEPSPAATVIFVGHARLPQSLAPRDSSPVVSVELETDSASGEIISVGARAIPDLGANLLASLLVGHNINESPEALVEEIRRRYVCPSQKAMSTAVVNAFEAYERYRQAWSQTPRASSRKSDSARGWTISSETSASPKRTILSWPTN